jgi:hypothetical protein
MKIRRCDMLLDAMANPMFADHEGPAFHLYWPLAKREQSRAAWRKWLAEAPDEEKSAQ